MALTRKKVEKIEEEVKPLSDKAKAFMQLMADYEAVNPEKFAQKKEALEAQLKTL